MMATADNEKRRHPELEVGPAGCHQHWVR